MVRGLDVFERNRVPLSLGFGLAFYIQLSSFRRAVRALSEIRRVSRKLLEWVRKLSEGININPLEYRRLIA